MRCSRSTVALDTVAADLFILSTASLNRVLMEFLPRIRLKDCKIFSPSIFDMYPLGFSLFLRSIVIFVVVDSRRIGLYTPLFFHSVVASIFSKVNIPACGPLAAIFSIISQISSDNPLGKSEMMTKWNGTAISLLSLLYSTSVLSMYFFPNTRCITYGILLHIFCRARLSSSGSVSMFSPLILLLSALNAIKFRPIPVPSYRVNLHCPAGSDNPILIASF